MLRYRISKEFITFMIMKENNYEYDEEWSNVNEDEDEDINEDEQNLNSNEL